MGAIENKTVIVKTTEDGEFRLDLSNMDLLILLNALDTFMFAEADNMKNEALDALEDLRDSFDELVRV